MAISSILENVRLTSPEAADMFVDALEKSAEMSRKNSSEHRYHIEKDPETVRRFVSRNQSQAEENR